MFTEIMLVGTLDGIDPTTKCYWGKFMLAFPIFSYFSTSDALVFAVHSLNYFPSQIKLCSVFCSCKKVPCIEFCSCAPYALCLVRIKILCTTPPPLSEPWLKSNYINLFLADELVILVVLVVPCGEWGSACWLHYLFHLKREKKGKREREREKQRERERQRKRKRKGKGKGKGKRKRKGKGKRISSGRACCNCEPWWQTY